ncbi:hypothetical protein [Streptomyces sp. NPDC057545]|uniref:hypothetical protein n=1 Tax=Streptomyces sp. NPDC057545 TaxID=3346164 RepID=UPI0036BD4750
MTSEDRWTPAHLQSPEDRAIHLAQRRAQLQPIVDDLRRLAREMEAEVKEYGPIEGDMPGQARLRARHVTRPLFKAADDVEKAVADLISFNARFQQSYEELPVKREAKREEKRRRKLEAKTGQPQAIESADSAPADKTESKTGGFGDVFDGLKRGA